jgi:hypothetical protein
MTTPKTSYTPTITKEQLPSLADVDHVFSWTPTTIEIAKLNTHMRERVDAYVCDYAPGLAVEDRGEYGAACTLTTDLRDARKHERDLTLRDWDRWNGFPPTGDEQHEQQNNTRPRGKRP